jgi:hypothetical protein
MMISAYPNCQKELSFYFATLWKSNIATANGLLADVYLRTELAVSRNKLLDSQTDPDNNAYLIHTNVYILWLVSSSRFIDAEPRHGFQILPVLHDKWCSLTQGPLRATRPGLRLLLWTLGRHTGARTLLRVERCNGKGEAIVQTDV